MFLGFIGDDPLAFDDLQQLVLVVNMGPGTCACAEVNTQEIKFVAVRGADQALEFYLSVKVADGRGVRLCLSWIDSGDLHRCLLKKAVIPCPRSSLYHSRCPDRRQSEQIRSCHSGDPLI